MSQSLPEEDTSTCAYQDCKTLGTLLCTGCSVIYYCSRDHQKKDYKFHKGSCRPFIIKRNETFGRYVVAARDLPQGTIVMAEGPVCVGPKRSTFPVCLGCHKNVDCTYHCSKCQFPMCSEACEKAPIHASNECPIFSSTDSKIGAKVTTPGVTHPAYESVLPLRCLLLREKNPSLYSKLCTMENLNAVRKNLPTWKCNQINTVNLIRGWYKLVQYSEEDVHSVIGYIDVNSFEIKGKDFTLCGLYPEAALMSHDCTPNTHHAQTTSGPNYQIIVRTSVPIRKGELITTSYNDPMNPTYERREFLQTTKYFHCQCKRCMDPTEFGSWISGVKCHRCEGEEGYFLPFYQTEDIENPHIPGVPSTWKCSNCDLTEKHEKIMVQLGKAKSEIEAARTSTSGNAISRLERVLRKLRGKPLHPNHFLLLGIVKDLLTLYGNDGAERKKELSQQFLHILDVIEPGLSRQRGVILYHLYLAESALLMEKRKDGTISNKEAKEKCAEMLVYLTTAKQTLELDRLLVNKPAMSLAVDEAIDEVVELEASLGTGKE